MSNREPASFACLRIVIWLAMIFLPWVAIAYLARLAIAGH